MPAAPIGRARAWLLASRPATLTAALAPVAVGTACALHAGGLRVGPALAALLGAVLIQLGTNYANDVFDFEKGADTAERLGPLRVTQAGLLRPQEVRRGMALAFLLAACAGLYLAFAAGPLVIAIGVASILSGVAYTGGPYPLGYHGLGDLFVLLFFGLVAVCGTAFVQVGSVPALSIWAALPTGALATAILVVNNLRDAPTDARAGKRTLVVRLGRRAGLLEYALLLCVAYAVPAGLVAGGALGPWGILPWLSAPLALRLTRRVFGARGAALNPLLGGTARLLLLFSLLFAAGITLDAFR